MFKKVILGISILSQLLAAFSFTLDKPSYHIPTSPGSETNCEVILFNENEYPLQVKIYLNDWRYREDKAGKIFLKPGTNKDSLAQWIKLSAEEIELPPRSQKVYSFKIQTPKDASGGQQAVIFFQAMLPRENEKDFKYAARLGCMVYQETNGKSEFKMEIIQRDIQIIDNKLAAKIVFKNTGNIWNELKGTIGLVKEETVIEQKKVITGKVLAGDTVTIKANLALYKMADSLLVSLEDYKGNLIPLTVELDKTSLLTKDEIVQNKVQEILDNELPVTEDNQNAIANGLELLKFNPLYSANSKQLKLFVQLKSNQKIRVNANCRIFDLKTSQRLKTIDFDEKIFDVGEEAILAAYWAAGEYLAAGKYRLELAIQYGDKVITDKKEILIN